MKILNQHEIQMISGGSVSLLGGCVSAIAGTSQKNTIVNWAFTGAFEYCVLTYVPSYIEGTPFSPDYSIIAKHIVVDVFQAFIGYHVGIFLKPEPATPPK